MRARESPDPTTVDARPPSLSLRPLAVGDRIARFVIEDELGAGGMGVVYSAYDPILDRRLAVKLVGDHRRSEQARLLREAQAMARIEHDNVVRVFEAGEFDGKVFIAMEVMEGGDLRQWIRRGEHSWRQIVELFVQAGQTHQDVPDWVERTADLDRLTRSEFGRPLNLIVDPDYAWPYVWSLRDRTGVSYPALETDNGTLDADVIISSWGHADVTRSRLAPDVAYTEIPYIHRVWWVPDYSQGRFSGWLEWMWNREPWGDEANQPGNFPGTVFIRTDVLALEARWQNGQAALAD